VSEKGIVKRRRIREGKEKGKQADNDLAAEHYYSY
jgi:hypothetical protein